MTTAMPMTSRGAVLANAPLQVEDTGLAPTLLGELLLKTMQRHGLQHLQALSRHSKLGAPLLEELFAALRKDGLVEIRMRGARDGDVSFDLTGAGRTRAAEALGRNQYTGPAPVSLADYAARVQAQSVAHMRVSRAQLHETLADVPMRDALREQIGAALNSRGAAMLYGPPGAGKTFLCRQLARLLSGTVALPYAIEVAGEIVQLFDPSIHRPVATADAAPASLDNRGRVDARWVVCERPFVVTGSELTLEGLDLVFDPRAGYYQAPPQVKANNGLLLVDDLGRQLVTPRQLLDRWLQPLEQRHDHLRLRNGATFRIPFDNQLFFSTNIAPHELADDAFLRRIGYKIHVGALAPDDYRRVVRAACAAFDVHCDDAAVDHLVHGWHERLGRPLLACQPRELAARIAERARYLGEPAAMTPAALAWAWNCCFDSHGAAGTSPASPEALS